MCVGVYLSGICGVQNSNLLPFITPVTGTHFMIRPHFKSWMHSLALTGVLVMECNAKACIGQNVDEIKEMLPHKMFLAKLLR